MEHLPVETLHQIFVLACTDGGRTGARLSLVSSAIRNAARPIRLHSVALRRWCSVASFLKAYKADRAAVEAEGKGYAPIVRHLLVLLPSAKTPTSGARSRLWQAHTPIASESDDSDSLPGPSAARRLRRRDPERGSIDELFDILCLLGPTLESFAFADIGLPLSSFLHCSMRMGGRPLESLREMTVIRNGADQFENVQVGASHSRMFPRLTRLHLVAVQNMNVPRTIKKWTEITPRITSIRLSHVRPQDEAKEWLTSMIGRSP